MIQYILKRLLLLPVTLFFIVLANFCLINLAPGEPAYLTDVGKGGEASRSVGVAQAQGLDERYLQFREFFGLTLPILFNSWPWITEGDVLDHLKMIASKKELNNSKELSAKEYSKLKVLTGDQARYVLASLVIIMTDQKESLEIRKLAFFYFIRGATGFSHIGAHLSQKQKEENKALGKRNLFLDSKRSVQFESLEQFEKSAKELKNWFESHKKNLRVAPDTVEKIKIFFFETRFFRYMSRVVRLDFGSLRSDPNRSVMVEVIKRLKYSLTLAILPMLATFFLCQIFGLFMAIWKNSSFDVGANIIFLLFYATPVFVVAPFLIEHVALHHHYPFTDYAFPIRGFSSEDSIYNNFTSLQRIADVARHITLPLITILYASLAMQSRLSRAIFLDTLHQDYVRTARAKGVTPFALYAIHVGRNAAIPILTSVAGSLGLILGGTIIIETIFEIHGFGKFFYDAIIDRDYNVMMFSALASSFLALVGYLVADITYMCLDPRISLEAKNR